MRKKRVPLQRIVILTVTGIFFMVFIEIFVMNRNDHNYLIEEKGTASIIMVSQRAEENVSAKLTELQLANVFYSDYIQRNRLYDENDLSAIREYSLEVAEKLQKKTPQITSLHYADLNNRFVGYLISATGEITLSLKNTTADSKLTFYRGKTSDTPILLEREGYNPSLRPWFTKVIENNQVQWSDVFISQDEPRAASISSVNAIFDDNGKLFGVACINIKMSQFKSYLEGIDQIGSGVIYIIDSKHEIIASSSDEEFPIYKNNPTMAEIPVATESLDPRISESDAYIRNHSPAEDEVFHLALDNRKYFGMISTIDNPAVDFRIVTLIPEVDLVGNILKTQYLRAIILVIIFIIGTGMATLILSRILKPVLQVAKQVEQISLQNFGEQIDDTHLPINETYQLVSAFNKMSLRMQSIIEEIKASENKFRTLVENIDEIVCNVSPEGDILMINKSLKKAFKEADYIGKNIFNNFGSSMDKNLWLSHWNRMLETRQNVVFTLDTHVFNDVHKIYNVQFIPQYTPSGSLSNVIITQADVTELLKAREQIENLLKSENERLEELVKLRTEELNITMRELMEREKMASLGGLVSGVAHEINTPLGVAVTASSFLADENAKIIRCVNEGTLTKQLLADYLENTEESAKIIFTNLERASNLISSFKKISVNQSDEMEMRFNLYDYLQSILLMLKHEYKNTGHSFLIDCPRSLYLVSSPGAYSQIFTNLIMNSLIHGFKEKDAGQISILAEVLKAKKDGTDVLRIEYRDNGVGIPEENLKRIFDPFFTTARGSGKSSGSGLGLSIVYNLITVTLKGSIDCVSMPSKGVLFTIEVPISNYSLAE